MSTGLVRTCVVCGQTKGLDFMAKSPQSPGGYRNLCKLCRNAQQIDRKEKRRKAAVRKVIQEREVRMADPTLVRPRTFAYAASTWKPEPPGYVRNGGNKHIPSRGV